MNKFKTDFEVLALSLIGRTTHHLVLGGAPFIRKSSLEWSVARWPSGSPGQRRCPHCLIVLRQKRALAVRMPYQFAPSEDSLRLGKSPTK